MTAADRFFTDFAAEVCGFKQRLQAGLCPTCGQKPDLRLLKDQQSRNEYAISGMCQTCQDRLFTSDDDDGEI